MADLQFKFVIQTIDKGGVATFRNIRNGMRGLNQEVKASPGGWSQARSAIDRANTSAGRFNTTLQISGRAFDSMIDRQRRLRRETMQTETVWSRFARTLGRGGPAGRDGRGGFGGAAGAAGAARLAGGVGTLAVAGGAATVGGGFAGLRSVIATGAGFESYRASLKTMEEGDLAKADKSIAWVKEFAKKTPYEIDQVMSAFVRLRSTGIEPTDGTLRSLGDASSATGKQLMDAVEMMADAQTGEFERLKEFNVQARQQGDRVTFTYQRAGKEMSVTSKKTATEIRRTLLGIFDGSFKGAMDEQSRTWNGMMSSMRDSRTSFLLKVAEKGSFDAAKKELSGFLAFLQKAEGDGRFDRWAGEISDSLVKLIQTSASIAREVDWVQTAKNITGVAEAILALVRAGNELGKLNVGGFSFADLQRGAPGMAYRSFQRLRDPDVRQRTDAQMAFTGNPMAYDESGKLRPSGRPRFSYEVAEPRRTLARGEAIRSLSRGPEWTLPAAPPQKLSGAISIGLAPGLELRSADFGPDIDYRRGPAGGGN